MALDRIVTLSSQSSLTGIEYTPYTYTTYRTVTSMRRFRQGYILSSTDANNWNSHQSWSLGNWPWTAYNPIPTRAYELLAPPPVIFWGRSAEDAGNDIILSPPLNNRPLTPGHIVVFNPDGMVPTVHLSITGTIPVAYSPGTQLLDGGYLGGVDESLTADNFIITDDGGSPAPDFELNGSITLGFSSDAVRSTLAEPRTDKVWAEIRETGSQASLTSVSGVDVGVVETEQTATIRTRFNREYSLAEIIIDDLQRRWTVIGSAATDDRRFVDFDCTRTVTTERTS